MPRRPSAAPAADFEHHRARDATEADESTRRRLIRWIKKTIGIGSTDPSRTPTPTTTATTTTTTTTTTTRNARHDRPGAISIGASNQHEPYDETTASGASSCRSDTSTASHRSRNTATSSSTSATKRPAIYGGGSAAGRGSQRLIARHEPHVIIIGGGIGGLCLAQGLKKNGIPFTVLERDPSPNYRTQGYRTRINGDGYEALKSMLPAESFEVFLRSTGHFFPSFNAMDAYTGELHGDSQEDYVTMPIFPHDSEITKQVFSANRAMLRTLLLLDLYEGTEIQYGMAFQRYESLPNGRVEVYCENGQTVQGTVLVGADGTTSRVRRQYVPRHTTLLDTDSGAIYGKTRIRPEIQQKLGLAMDCTTIVNCEYPKMALLLEPQCKTPLDLSQFPSTGSYDNQAAEEGSQSQELHDLHKYLCWVLLARADNFQLAGNWSVHELYCMDPEQLAGVSMELTKAWHPDVKALLETQAPEWCSFMRISTTSPEIRAWTPSAVTLLGDAVHTMAPAGIGGNTALQDAHLLCDCFVKVGVNVEAIAEYEQSMRDRGRAAILSSVEAGRRMYDLPAVEDMEAVVY